VKVKMKKVASASLVLLESQSSKAKRTVACPSRLSDFSVL